MMGDDTAGKIGLPKLHLGWDTNTAVAVLVLGSLALLIALRKGFRPVLVG